MADRRHTPSGDAARFPSTNPHSGLTARLLRLRQIRSGQAAACSVLTVFPGPARRLVLRAGNEGATV